MTQQEIQTILEKQRNYFATGATLPVSARISALKKLQSYIKEHEQEISNALAADLGKSKFEGYMCEIGLVLGEISYMIKHIKKFARNEKKLSCPANYVASSFIKKSPYGAVLIMSPWNYPFLLTIEPLVDAISAGNTVIAKPSAYSPNTTKVIEKLINECFAPEYVAIVTGGRAENTHLLEQKFDYIFFTGSQTVGREVMRKAAEKLIPVTLELGGKSPCIVDKTANIALAAKRIVWGKFLNCGQTCVAPDYILCHESVKEKLIAELKKQIEEINAQINELERDDTLEQYESDTTWRYEGYILNELGCVNEDNDSIFNANEHNPYRHYMTEEYANKAAQMKKFNDMLMAFKWCYDRDYEPDWTANCAKYYIVYNSDDNPKHYCISWCYRFNHNIIYFSSEDIARKCADWLNNIDPNGELVI